MSSAAKMKVKATTLYYVMCSLGNILHVYQICDEYLRYDVTTNVQVAVPDEIPFPSITLCVDLIDSLNWTAISNETRRKLLYFLPEPTALYMVRNPDKILSMIKKMPQSSRDLVKTKVYGGLVNELSISEIMNISALLSDMVDTIKISKLLYNESQLVSFRKEEKVNRGKIIFKAKEFHIMKLNSDMTYIHLGEKCIVMRPQPELQSSINYNDQISRSGNILLQLEGQYNRPIRIYALSHGYFKTSLDSRINVEPDRRVKSPFVIHSSSLLEYPYKTNCRDYTKIGILSRNQCRQECFKAIAISHFNRIPEESYAFKSDSIYLQTPRKDNECLFEEIAEQCKQTCFQRECQSLVYIQPDAHESLMTSPYSDACAVNRTSKGNTHSLSACEREKQLEKSYLFMLIADVQPGTRTEAQAALSLISFLTGLFSTFGFWLGLSVFGSANFIQILWSKTRRNKKLKPRYQQDVVRIIRRQQSTSHMNSSWKQVKVSSPVHRLSTRRTCQ